MRYCFCRLSYSTNFVWITLALFAAGCGGDALRGPELSSSLKTVNPFGGDLFARSQSPDDELTLETTVETPMVGDYTTIEGLHFITLEGVGLVVGLDGNGGDPPPSHYREALLDEMRRRDIKNPNQLLASPDTALVVVRAYLPPLVAKGDRFDVEVRVPGKDDTKSLNGGLLYETYLSEHAVVPGEGVMTGREFAIASGPILVSASEGDREELAGVLKRGRVLGGGVSKTDRHLTMYLRNDFASFRNSVRIAEKIGDRFYRYNRAGIREPLAEAKTHQRIELNLQPRYKENYPRFLQAIRHIAFRETDVAKHVRVEKLADKLNNPPTAEKAALELEAVGRESIPVLRDALENPDLEVRFHAAMAITYLGEPDGIDALVEAARDEPAFRVYALAGLAATDDATAHVGLRSLLDSDSAETRYGAFRALSVLDKRDPFIEGEPLPSPTDRQFMLHALDTKGEPMVHLTNRKIAEVVVFGASQPFETPLALRAGRHILVTASPGSATVKISRFQVGRTDEKREVPNRVVDVVRAVTEMGATYPDVAQLLTQADQQHNLIGRLEVDALPKSGRIYYRDAEKTSSSRVGGTGLLPNLFEAGEEESSRNRSSRDEDEDSFDSEEKVEASVKDKPSIEEEKDENPENALLRDERKWYDPRRLLGKPQLNTD